ncbi:hypothetical protein Peur_017838 [Populus x canadensis]
MNIVRISDWMPENEPSLITGRRVQPPSPQPSGNVSPQQQLPSSTGCKFRVVLELAGLGTSVTEHTPRRFYTCHVINISEDRFKASMAMSPSQMLRGVLGFWSPLMTALGSPENMPVSDTLLLFSNF